MEDEIDLAQYVKTIFKHWKLVVGITLAAVVTAGIVSFAAPPTYEATVLLQSYEATPNRMSELAQSSETARFMVGELTDRLTPDESNLAAVKNIFKIETSGTLITCTARSAEAQRSATLANAWATAFTKYAAQVSLNSMLPASDLQTQIESAYAVFQETQASYESFNRTSHVEKISNQIASARLQYQALTLQESLNANYGSSGTDQATSLAYLLIKLRSYTVIPEGTQISAGAAPPVSKADVDNLVRELEDRSGIHGKTAGDMFNEINTLSSKLERENQRSRELINSRDAAWNAYLTALKNSQEISMMRSAMISPVRVLYNAMPPQYPVPTNRLFNIGIALVLGLILGVIAAFVAEYIEKRRPARPAAKPES
ncbi:MAG: Wzz/FepE/Etk N-terminal domain-containing protein [Dehalococcoidia bacterium]